MKKLRLLAALALLLIIPGTHAVSFTEDFEGFDLSIFAQETAPDQDWYDYREANAVGEVSSDPPILSDAQWMRFQAPAGDPSANRGDFNLAVPEQLTNFSFQVAAITPTDDGNGSRQYISIQSGAPRRTLVEFYVFCTDDANPDGCEFRVRFANVDTKGQVLINTTLGLSIFNVTILPDWTQGQYQLFVNGVDDGTFPFLELPQNIGRLRVGQASGFYPLNASIDNWFIDGASDAAAAIDDDIVTELQDFADEISFTTPTSLFLLGILVFVSLVLALILSTMSLGGDNTIIPPLAFFAVLVALWLVMLEWWPEWIGLTLIIIVSALVSLLIREKVMGIRDASTDAGIVAGALGYFIIATTLLGFSGYAAEDIELPTGDVSVPEDDNVSATKQSFGAAVVECIATPIISAFTGDIEFDCSRETRSDTWGAIVDFATTVFNFARTAFSFLFQLLAFQLPVPTVFNVLIVAPPASSLAIVGYRLITRSGS